MTATAKRNAGPDNGPAENAGVVAPPPLIYLGALAAGMLANRVIPLPLLPRGRARAIGLPLVGGALALGGWFVKTMTEAHTPVDVRKPVTALVTDGPFRYSRNPAYVSLTLLYVGVAARRDALWPMLLLPGVLVVIRRGVIDREERYLERRFGEEYVGYKARVRRWV